MAARLIAAKIMTDPMSNTCTTLFAH